jgi:hypothetical protein
LPVVAWSRLLSYCCGALWPHPHLLCFARRRRNGDERNRREEPDDGPDGMGLIHTLNRALVVGVSMMLGRAKMGAHGPGRDPTAAAIQFWFVARFLANSTKQVKTTWMRKFHSWRWRDIFIAPLHAHTVFSPTRYIYGIFCLY